MSEMQKKNWEVTDFVLKRTYPEEHPKSEKNRSSLTNKVCVCKPKNIAI